MLNEKDIVSQARDKGKENLNWIETESELRQALGITESRVKRPRESVVGRAIEVVKSLILLKWPALGHR
jgi:hypothetical protein